MSVISKEDAVCFFDCQTFHLSIMITGKLIDDIRELKGAISELQRKAQVVEDRWAAGELGTSYEGRWNVLVCVFRNSGEPTTTVVPCFNDMGMSVFRERAGIPDNATILCPCPTGKTIDECGIRHFVAAMEAGYKPESGPHITVIAVTKRQFTAPIHEYMDVDALRHYTRHAEGIPQDQHRFVFNGRRLEDGMRLYDYGIRPGDTVDFLLMLRG